MPDFKFPANDLQRAEKLAALLGSFWSETYNGQSLVKTYLGAVGEEGMRAQRILLESIATLSRYDVPIYSEEHWYLLTLKESDKNSTEAALLRYGDGAIYGNQPDGTQYFYDIPAGRGNDCNFPLHEDIADVPIITNRLTDPSVVLHNDIDFQIQTDRNAIVFLSDPFENELIAQQTVGNDREAYLWMHRAQFDFELVYKHFGYALALRMASSEGYKEVVNAILDSYTRGTAAEQILLLLGAMSDLPVVREPIETVETVSSDRHGKIVATDKHAYVFTETAEILVEEGDVLRAGDTITESFEVLNLNRGSDHITTDLPAISLGRGYIGKDFAGALVFENRTVPVVVTTEDSYTKVEFELGGNPDDVEDFWDQIHANGIAAGETLAHLLDTRTNQVGEPAAINLPTEINPFEFLVDNFLRGNALLVRLKARDFGPQAIDIGIAAALRRILPPHNALLLLIELQPETTEVTLDNISEEGFSFFDGHALATEIGTSNVDVSCVKIKHFRNW